MLLSFAGRLGQLLISPRAAFRRVDAQGGGFRDMLALVAIGAVCLRFPQLAEAVLGLAQPSQGTLLRVIGVFSNEAREAAMVVIPATLILVGLAGRRRDPTLDLELGAACFAPFFVGRALVRVASAVTGHTALTALPPEFGYGLPIVWTAWALYRAVQVARARPEVTQAGAASDALAPLPSEPGTDLPAGVVAASAVDLPPASPSAAPSPSAPPRESRLAGLSALVLVVVGLGFNIAWASRHLDALRPMAHGEPAPEVNLPRVDGGEGRLSLAALRGKVVLLDFWATWCPPCLQMIPILHDLHAEWSPRGVEIVGVNSDGVPVNADEIRAFLRVHPAPYPMLIDDDGTANALYKIRALPEMVLIDREGAVRKVFIGYTSRRELASAFAEAVGVGPANH